MSGKTKPEQGGDGRFISGNIGGGRPKGARSKLNEQFLGAMLADFEANGAVAIARVREEKPDQYLRVIAAIVPKELNVVVDEFEGMTDADLIAQLRAMDAVIRPFLDAADEDEVSGTEETTH